MINKSEILAQFLGRLVEERFHRPVRRGVRDLGCEVEKDVGAVWRVHDFGMELQLVEFA